MTPINERTFTELRGMGFGALLNFIHGDRIDDTFEGNFDLVSAFQQMPKEHVKFLKKNPQPLVHDIVRAYQNAPRNSNGSEMILSMARLAYEAHENAELNRAG